MPMDPLWISVGARGGGGIIYFLVSVRGISVGAAGLRYSNVGDPLGWPYKTKKLKHFEYGISITGGGQNRGCPLDPLLIPLYH